MKQTSELKEKQYDTDFPFGKTTIKEIFRKLNLHNKKPFSEVFEFYTTDYAEKALEKWLSKYEADIRADEREAALEIAKHYTLNRSIGSPSQIVLNENEYRKYISQTAQPNTKEKK